MTRKFKISKPVWLNILAGIACVFAFAPFHVIPLAFLGFGYMTYRIMGLESPRSAFKEAYWFAAGFFVVGLSWIPIALIEDIETLWWIMPFALLILPLFLSSYFGLAAWVAARLAAPQSFARFALFISALGLFEFARAFGLSGFPWNLFGTMWMAIPAVAQTAAFGGAYFLTLLTFFWAGSLGAAYGFYRLNRRGESVTLVLAAVISFAICLAAGAQRLDGAVVTNTPDIRIAIIQANIPQNEKWDDKKALDNLLLQTDMGREAIRLSEALYGREGKTLVFWPETALSQSYAEHEPKVTEAIETMLDSARGSADLVTGFWRRVGVADSLKRREMYNSLLALDNNLKSLATYDKHHLVPFGEYVPFEEELNLTPATGFAGFRRGSGVEPFRIAGAPTAVPIICYEAIFPWYAALPEARWIINVSNDAWYGNSHGPYQHYDQTAMRAIEQGKPVVRSAVTGISGIIDPYGRTIKKLGYNKKGNVIARLPEPIENGTFYGRHGEVSFFIALSLGFAFFAFFRLRKI